MLKATYRITMDFNNPERDGDVKSFDLEYEAQQQTFEHINKVQEWANGAIVTRVKETGRIEFTHIQNEKGEWEPTCFQPSDFKDVRTAIRGIDFVPLFGNLTNGVYVATQENGKNRYFKGIEK